MTIKRTFIFAFVILAIFLVSFLLIQFAKGYRPDFSKRTLRPTGLLVATSVPDGAQVFIDGKLKSATNNTISLAPGEYEVEIKKDGFSTWKKSLKIEKELVVKTDAYLFPLVPDLKALTFTGAADPVLSPDGTKVVYGVEGATVGKNGLWILDLPDLPFGRIREPRQIVRSAPRGRNFAKADYKWSPDSKKILVSLGKENFLLDQGSLTPATALIDVSENLNIILRQWEDEETKRQEQKLKKLPKELVEIIKTTTKAINFSLDETKILYTATASATLEDELIPPILAASTQKQERKLKPGQIYIYDIKEDRNFQLMEGKEDIKVLWFPTSKHLLIVEEGKVQIVEYDSTNAVTVYGGPFEDLYAFPWPNGNKILVLTLLSGEEDSLPNLYAVSLR